MQLARTLPYGNKGGFRSPLIIPNDQEHSPWTLLIIIFLLRADTSSLLLSSIAYSVI
ncbi:hypothetical protein CCP2SC5_210042 [Azospirillaceae bacterium]